MLNFSVSVIGDSSALCPSLGELQGQRFWLAGWLAWLHAYVSALRVEVRRGQWVCMRAFFVCVLSLRRGSHLREDHNETSY